MRYTNRRAFLKGTGVAGAGALTGLAGCTGSLQGGAADSLSVGVVTDTSGPYTHLGNSVIQGLKLGFAHRLEADTEGLADSDTVSGNGMEITLHVEDSELSADTGRQKARRLVQREDVDVLQGSVSSAVASAVQDVATTAELPMYVCTAAATSVTGEDCNKYTFRTSQTTYQDALAGGRYAANNLGSSFYFLGADYSWGQDSVAQWKSVIQENGGEVAGESYASFGTDDFTPHLQQMQDSDADALVVALTGADAITFTRDLNDFGGEFPVTATGVTTIPWMQQVGTNALRFEGIPKYFWTFPDNETNDWLIEQYGAHWDTVPSIFTAAAHAAGYGIAQGFEAAGSSDADPLIEEWHGMTIERTARGDGAYTLRECDHQAKFPMYLGYFEENDDDMDVTPVLDDTYEADPSIRACSETGCSMNM